MIDQTVIRSPDTQRQNRIPPGQRLTNRWPILHYGSVPQIVAEKWELRVWGLVEKETTVTWQQFESLPRVKVFSDVHCVTTWSKLDNLWEGVSTRAIVDLVDPRPEARFVLVHSPGGFTTNLSLEDFLREDVLLATRHDGNPISPEHGYPVRLVVPRLYFWKSAKWLNGLEFLAKDKLGFWESHGYHPHGDPWLEERYSI